MLAAVEIDRSRAGNRFREDADVLAILFDIDGCAAVHHHWHTRKDTPANDVHCVLRLFGSGDFSCGRSQTCVRDISAIVTNFPESGDIYRVRWRGLRTAL